MKNKRKLYIVTNVDLSLNRIFFYEFTKKKEAEEFYNSPICINTKWNKYNYITIDGNQYKKAQSIKINPDL